VVEDNHHFFARFVISINQNQIIYNFY